MTLSLQKWYKNIRPTTQGGVITDADNKQLRHNVLGALAERLHTIKMGDAPWHEFHQTGVLLSELAESLWLLYGYRRGNDYMATLDAAIHYFTKARDLAESNETGHENTLARAQINCDSLRASYRYNRLVENTPVTAAEALSAGFHATIDVLEKLQKEVPAALQARVRHQQAIAHAFALEVCNCSVQHYNDAFILLSQEDGKDSQQAFRTLQFIAALRAAKNGTMMQCRVYAEIALVSARQNNDRQHELRALLIKNFGVLGEKLCCAKRDGFAAFYL